VDLPIPGNDDGIRSIELIARHLSEAILIGSQSSPANRGKEKGEPAGSGPRGPAAGPSASPAAAEGTAPASPPAPVTMTEAKGDDA